MLCVVGICVYKCEMRVSAVYKEDDDIHACDLPQIHFGWFSWKIVYGVEQITTQIRERNRKEYLTKSTRSTHLYQKRSNPFFSGILANSIAISLFAWIKTDDRLLRQLFSGIDSAIKANIQKNCSHWEPVCSELETVQCSAVQCATAIVRQAPLYFLQIYRRKILKWCWNL